MPELREALALFVVLNVLAGLVRVVRGPTRADRMVVAQLFGTTAVTSLLLLSIDHGRALRDVALVFALLGAVLATAFVRLSTARADSRPQTSRQGGEAQ